MTRTLLIPAALALGAALATTPASADDYRRLFCAQLTDVAQKYGEARYDGVPLSEMMQSLTEAEVSPKVKELSWNLLLAIYELPDYPDAQQEQNRLRGFTATLARACIENFDEIMRED